jgi:anti-sigma B factor antagonist
MPGREFEATVAVDGERTVLSLHGDINAGARGRLEAAYTEAERARTEAMVLDFSDVEYINSTGIALIVGVLARARAANLAVVAFGLSDHYRQIFQITRLSDFVGIYPDQATALEAAQAV